MSEPITKEALEFIQTDRTGWVTKMSIRESFNCFPNAVWSSCPCSRKPTGRSVKTPAGHYQISGRNSQLGNAEHRAGHGCQWHRERSR